MKLFVFLPLENYRRELDFKINLARFLCAEGFNVIIADSERLRDYLLITRYRGVFIEKGSLVDPNYYKKLKDKGIITYDLCEEGAFSGSYWMDEEGVVKTIKQIRKVFLWGEFQRNDLLSSCRDPHVLEKFLVTGHPSFEISQKKYLNIFNHVNPFRRKSKYILINTNFSCSTNSFDDVQAQCASRPKKYADQLSCYFKYSIEKFEIFKKDLHNIIRKFDSEVFLIRPHPVENESIYVKEFGNYSNVIISKLGTINPVLSGAKIVLHNDCSTALQAYLMGIPVISLNHGDVSEKVFRWTHDFGALPKNIDETFVLLNNLLKDENFDNEMQNSIDSSAKNTINKYFHRIDGVSDYIAKYISNDIFKERLCEGYTYKINFSFINLKRFLSLFIKYRPKKHYQKKHYETQICINLKDIQKKLRLFEESSPISCTYKVKEIYDSFFMIKNIS